jgi:hypothetical protein
MTSTRIVYGSVRWNRRRRGLKWSDQIPIYPTGVKHRPMMMMMILKEWSRVSIVRVCQASVAAHTFQHPPRKTIVAAISRERSGLVLIYKTPLVDCDTRCVLDDGHLCSMRDILVH